MDVTANLVTTTQLQNWAQQAVQRQLCTGDEWCWGMNSISPGSCTSIDPILTCVGMVADGSNRSSLPQITADQFLTCLRNYQLGSNSVSQGPGGTTQCPTGTILTSLGTCVVQTTPVTSTTGTTPPGTGTTGTGVLGTTNCSLCQELSSDPLLLLVLLLAVYFFFFRGQSGI